MPKVTNLEQAIDETLRLLQLPKYRTYKEVNAICLRQLSQLRVLELMSWGEDKDTIAGGTGLDEKTIRFYQNAKHAPKLPHLMLLEDYRRRVKRRHGKKSSR